MLLSSLYSKFGKNPHSQKIDPADFKREFLYYLSYLQGVTPDRANIEDKYKALSETVRRFLRAQYNDTYGEIYHAKEIPQKTVCYLSAEYLLGKQLQNNLHAMGIEELVRKVLAELDIDYNEVLSVEIEPALGNGGLGRLAACYLDSMATMNIPSISYGIRYEYGMFKQVLDKGHQEEFADFWLRKANPWEHEYLRNTQMVGFGGRVKVYKDKDGVERRKWKPGWQVQAVPYNYLVAGYNTSHVNVLRLWSARSGSAFDVDSFNRGLYEEAARSEIAAETITKVLYPEDSTRRGKELRLEQQYFFVAASIKDILRRTYKDWRHADLSDLPERVVFQLNDTHPVIGIPELMRILVDECYYDWNRAWKITSQCFNYTCHTLMPEALEEWPEEMFGQLLPRHLEIIQAINRDFIAEILQRNDVDLRWIPNLSIIREVPHRAVRMAYLATIGSKKVNGVAQLHTDLLRSTVLKSFNLVMPEKFVNVTNGVSPRRFIHLTNPGLSELITDTIGTDWLTDLNALVELEAQADDPALLEKFMEVKARNKVQYASYAKKHCKVELDPTAMMDSMTKRIHEYKRQHLKLLQIVSIYQKFQNGELTLEQIPKRTFVLAGKAAPGYHMAKEIIRLALAIAAKINATPGLNERIKLIFHPNYNVEAAMQIIPATDLSEQISQAGKEASGTSNMKFCLNGSLVVGTMDGANVEIYER
ncbi:MAG: glycogen/starch/alpha-glucan family phosphorylase, partial [Bifidobacteriaceae bacterium]|nr:glycogen/starch/alpha-glucan family phosphorylase [Bifidobacteriaceae bacterium]